MEALAEQIEFEDPARARKNLNSLEGLLPGSETGTLTAALKQVPDPDASLNYLERLAQSSAESLRLLFENRSWLHAALALFSHSHYLAQGVVRYPELLEWALDEERLYRVLETDEIRSHLGSMASAGGDASVALTLVGFKRMHMMRIALRDVLGLATLAETTLELSNLADAILRGGLDYLYAQLAQRFGRPLCRTEDGALECGFVVLALGKLGGRELNYSSDIDLMFLYTGDGETSGPIRISNKEFCAQAAHRLTGLLSATTAEGQAYRVDLRLRPEGSAGEVVLPVDAAAEYYDRRARDWELQMLIKARPAAGSRELGAALLDTIDPLIYRTSTDFSMIERVAETRDRMQQKLRKRGDAEIDVKLTRGGIRDIEFLVQCLQRLYGGRDPWVRHGGTLLALHRLRDKGYLSMPDFARLSAAYQYLRRLEHRLQLENNRQTHKLPAGEAARRLLTRKMAGPGTPLRSTEDLLAQLDSHLKAVTEIYERVIHAQPAPENQTRAPADRPPEPDERPQPKVTAPDPSWENQLVHLERESPAVARAVRELPVRRGRKYLDHFLSAIVSRRDILDQLEKEPAVVSQIGDLMEHSPYLAEQLMRWPEQVRTLRECVSPGAAPGRARPDDSPWDQRRAEDCYPEVRRALSAAPQGEKAAAWLRRFYREEMFRLLAESVCCRHPIFATLEKTSRLADRVIEAAYQIAVREACGAQGREAPPAPLEIIALGRLGMREFDLGSDADLVFISASEDPETRRWWTRVTGRIIEIISSYTAEGMMFSIDTRLRPMGRDGELVQSERQYREYFAEKAEAWEALTFMKARTVAGDFGKATALLRRLQDVEWRRYGLSENLAGKLVEMRRRLEQEQGERQPLKAGPGGYYDLDFMLMFLRLREAGVFFPSLNTTQRIDVITNLGGLTPELGEDLHRRAIFYRSLDHAIRLIGGHSSSKIPSSPAQQQMIAELVGRWSQMKPPAGGLPAFVEEVRRSTRELFSRVFGETAA